MRETIGEAKELIRLATAGSVDDGKSTLIGQLLYQAQALPEDQLASLRRASGGGQELDLAWITDGLKAERAQGITIDVAYRYFSTSRRSFVLADCPGHEEYTRNMTTGVSSADIALVLVDACSGVTTQSRRHLFIASVMGVQHVVVVLNKMDLVAFSKERYFELVELLKHYCTRLTIKSLRFLPLSALRGDNVLERSASMPWYQGATLMSLLETIPVNSGHDFIDLRLPIQLVSRFGPRERGYAGSLAAGVVREGEEVVFLPSMARAVVKEVMDVNARRVSEAFVPQPVTLRFDEELDIARGEIMARPGNVPRVVKRLEAMLIWMGDKDSLAGEPYLVKHATRQVRGRLSKVRYRIDLDSLHRDERVSLSKNQIGRAHLELSEPLAVDPYSKNRVTGSFLLIDPVSYETMAAGTILDRRAHEQVEVPLTKEARREARLGHQAMVIWVCGADARTRALLVEALDEALSARGCVTASIDRESLEPICPVNPQCGPEMVARRLAGLAKVLSTVGAVVLCSTEYDLSGEEGLSEILSSVVFHVVKPGVEGAPRLLKPKEEILREILAKGLFR